MPAPPLSLATIRQPAFLYDADGRIAEANDKAEALAGRPLAGLSPADMARIFRHRRPDGTPLASAELPVCIALTGGEMVEAPFLVTTSDGRTIEILATASPIREEGIVGALVLWQDITGRKRAEETVQRRNEELAATEEELRCQNEELMIIQEELRQSNDELLAAQHRIRESEEKLRSVLDNSRDFVYRANLQTGTYVYVSPSVKEVMGYTPEEFAAMDSRATIAMVHPDDLPLVQEALGRLPETGAEEVEYRLQTGQGEYRWVSNSVSILNDSSGRPLYRTGSVRDITKRKRAEEALRESERRFRMLHESLRDAFVEVSMDGCIVGFNDHYCEMLGYSPEEMPALTYQALTPERWHAMEDAIVREQIVARGYSDVYEKEYRRKDGTVIPVELRTILSRDDEGRPIAMWGIVRDIADRKRVDEALRLTQASIDGAAEMVAWFRPDGSVYYVNDATCRMLGYSREELLKMSALDFSPGFTAEQYEEHWREVRARKSFTLQPVHRRKDGSTYTAEVLVNHVVYGGQEFIFAYGRDITERKKAEEALRETRDYLDNLITYANAPIIVWDPDLRITLFNAAFEEMSGYAADGVIGRELFVLFPEESRDESLAKIERTVAEQWQSVEIPILRPDGGVRIALWNSANIYDTEGTTLVATIAQGQDITERKQAEDALRRSEEHLKLAQETAHMGTTVWDQRTGTLWWSEEQRRIFGIDTETEITFEQYLSLVHPDDRSYVVNAIDEGLSTKKTEGMNYRIIRPDGKIRFIHGEGRIFYDGDSSSYVIGTVQDVTERKRAEEALRESEEKYRRVFETMSEGFIIGELIRDDGGTALDYRFLEANPAYERLTGFSRERSLSMTIRELIPDLEAAWIEQHARVVENGESLHWEQYNAATGGWYEIISVPAGPERFASIFLNITDRKENDEALRIYAENLQRSNEDLERFAYVSSHDLQEPLRAIVSFSQLLERRYRGQLSQDADEYIEFIVEGGLRMQALIQDLLAYSRVNTTKQDLRPTDTEEVLAAVERNLDLQLREGGAVLTHDAVPVVLADPLQLEQVFANLISNAIKFRRPDEPLRIHVNAKRLDGFWEFSVSDNGIGIEAEYLDRIFVIFQRLHTKDQYPGTGIGLAIVKRIIDRHGGTIRVESRPGEGSTFFFTLPAA